MKKMKISTVLLLLLIVFTSCSNDDGLETTINENIKAHNIDLITSYEFSNSKNKDLADNFSSYFSDYQFYIENEIITLGEFMTKKDLTSEDFYQLYLEKANNYGKNGLAKNGDEDCTDTCEEEKPTDNEIRDAMMDECEEYYLLEYPCKAAVEIAYILR